MRDDASSQAMDALKDLDRLEEREVLGWLCGTRPEAVLAAIEGVKRHHEVVAGLLQGRAERS